MKRLVLLLALLPMPAAAIDYADYSIAMQSESGRKAIVAYLDGFGEATGTYETRQAMDNRARRFCPPQGTKLRAELLAGLIDSVLKQQPHLAQKDMPVGALIWIGLERQFPCPKATSG